MGISNSVEGSSGIKYMQVLAPNLVHAIMGHDMEVMAMMVGMVVARAA